LLFGEDAHGVGELNLAACAGFGAFETIENRGRKDVATGDGEIGRGVRGFRFLDEIANAEEAFAERGEGRGFAGNDSVEMGFVVRNFFDGDRAGAGSVINIDELFGGGIRAGDQHVAKEYGERFIADKILRDQDGVAEAEGLFLASVADLEHVTDAANHLELGLFAFFFQEALEHGSVIEVIFDGIFALAGNDNDVFDAGGDTLFGDILNLRFVDDDKHFFGLGFGGGKEARAKTGRGENCFANFANWWMVWKGLNGIGSHRRVGGATFRANFDDIGTVDVAGEVCQSREAGVVVKVTGEGQRLERDARSRGRREDSGRFVNRNEKVGFVIGAVTFTSRFDFPVGGRRIGEPGAGLILGQREGNGQRGVDGASELIAREGRRVLVEFEAHHLRGATIPRTGGDIFFLDAAQGKREFRKRVAVARNMETSGERTAEEVGIRIETEEAIPIAQKFGEHLHPTYPENQADESEEGSENEEDTAESVLIESKPEKGNQESVPKDCRDETANHCVKGRK
jgi:hypothetical protein